MSSADAKSFADKVLHQALDARMLKAIEFAAIVAELESIDLPLDEYLVTRGYITEEQRAQILCSLREGEVVDVDTTLMESRGGRGQRPPANLPSSLPSFEPGGFVPGQPIPKVESDTRYEWVEQFAQGGLGAVWRARDTTIDRNVALKEILPDAGSNHAAVEQFVVEARITGQLQHPGVVPIYDMGINPDGRPFYVMKFVEGQTLHDAIRQRFSPDLQRSERDAILRKLLVILVQVCRTLDYAHARGYLHRDIKPRNIMLGDYGETLVVDWGLAMPIPKDAGDTIQAGTSGKRQQQRSAQHPMPDKCESGFTPNHDRPRRHIVGTPSYLSPEQARGEIGKLDARSDIYSLGVVLFEILTGLTPFPGKDTDTIINAVVKGKFPAPRQILRDIPAPLNSICLQAMQLDRADRFATAGEMADELERYLNGQRVKTHPESRAEQVQRVLANNKKTTFSALCGLIVLTLVAMVAAFQINQARQAEKQARLTAEQARVIAEQAREAEAQARELERVAKQAAVGNLQSAIDAVDTWLLGLSGDLEFYPGLSEKRRDFLNSAVNYYATLSQPACEDSALQTQAARAAIRHGDALQLLGNAQEALPELEQAIQWFRSEVSRNATNTDAHCELANALLGFAIAATQAERAPQDVTAALAEAKTLLRHLAIATSDDLRIQTAFARANVAEARLHLATESTVEAIRQLEAARRGLEDITSRPECEARHVALYHSTLFELAQLYLDAQEAFQAERAMADAIDSFDRMIAQSPRRPDYYEGRMTARILLGNALEAQGREQAALTAYELASDDYRQLISSLFRGDYQSENLLKAQVNRAHILRRHGNEEEAYKVFLMAQQEAGQLVATHGQIPRLLRLFAATTVALAESQAALGHTAEAEKSYRDAVLVLTHLEQAQLASADDLKKLQDAQHYLQESLQPE